MIEFEKAKEEIKGSIKLPINNVDLVYDTALLKVNLLTTRDKVYSKLGEFSEFKVEENNNIKKFYVFCFNI